MPCEGPDAYVPPPDHPEWSKTHYKKNISIFEIDS